MRTWMIFLPVFLALCATGCSDETINRIVSPEDLSPPLGLQSITGDGQVTLMWWCSNYSDDLVGYKVFAAEGAYQGDPRDTLPAGFSVVDSIAVTPPCNERLQMEITGLANGTTYSFLVVAARNEWKEISNTSNIVEDSPRPESAQEAVLYARQVNPSQAGYELSTFSGADATSLDQNYDTASGIGDIMCERFNPGAGMRAWIDGINGARIQGVGYLQDWQNLDEAPAAGYSNPGHSVEALLGHVYVVWTADDHYAMIQVMEIDESFEWIRIKAAYQTQVGNRELKL